MTIDFGPEQDSESLNVIKTVNPANGEVVANYKEMSRQDAAIIVDMAHKAYQQWRTSDFNTRADSMNKAAELLKRDKEMLAALMTMEMGKPSKQGLAEIEKCAWVCEYYAENAREFLQDETVTTDARESFITYQPIGVVLAVMPWNFPFWQVFRFAAPALMAGNGAVLKHARSVCGCALEIEKIFVAAGFPENLFRTLLIDNDKVASVIEHRHVRAVTLTGSTAAGRSVAAQAGKNLKKTVLELGGSDPYIILPDADLPTAAKACATSRLINGGQSCIAAKRFIVVEQVYDEFLECFKAELAAKKMGDPNNDDSDLGPQASVELRDKLHEQVKKSIAKGANCLLGGEIPDQSGAWYPPTLLADVVAGMPAYTEELFGPVAVVIKARDLDHAIDIANSSDFGLGGALFTRDIETGRRIAREQIDSGAVTVNGFVKSDPRLPFGGVKDSGYGRELSYFGIREFVNIKAVSIDS